METTSLITPRRGFLIRALGFTAAGATVAVPVVALASPEERARFHFAELARAIDERSLGADGWLLQAGRREAVNSMPASRWTTLNLIHFNPGDACGDTRLIVERHEMVDFNHA